MLQSLFQRIHNLVFSASQQFATSANSSSRKSLSKPLFLIAIIVALIMVVMAVVARAALSDTPKSAVTSQETEAQSETQAVLSDESEHVESPATTTAPEAKSETPASTEVYSTELRTEVVNGQASSSLKINGQEVPVQQPSTIQPQASVNNSVIIQNNQTYSTGSVFSNQSSSSFSHSFQSNIVGENHQ